MPFANKKHNSAFYSCRANIEPETRLAVLLLFTQVPQFLIEALGREANLIVTQPRRISAVSLAHRVSQEGRIMIV